MPRNYGAFKDLYYLCFLLFILLSRLFEIYPKVELKWIDGSGRGWFSDMENVFRHAVSRSQHCFRRVGDLRDWCRHQMTSCSLRVWRLIPPPAAPSTAVRRPPPTAHRPPPRRPPPRPSSTAGVQCPPSAVHRPTSDIHRPPPATVRHPPPAVHRPPSAACHRHTLHIQSACSPHFIGIPAELACESAPRAAISCTHQQQPGDIYAHPGGNDSITRFCCVLVFSSYQ